MQTSRSAREGLKALHGTPFEASEQSIPVTPAIRVVGVSKRYQLGQTDAADGSLRERLVDLAKAPVRRMRHLSGGAGAAESFWALDDVAFDVQPGEVAGVIGRNGAGKSTLLKILSRITDPTRGRIELRGRVASLLEVGTGFHPDLTGRENVFLNGAILGMGRAEIRRKFDAIVDFAEVAKFIETPVKHYSSGMYLRLAFAVAAHLDGEILLVDEVLAVGDAAFQRKCLDKMQEVSRGGRAVLFISHNMAAVAALCSRAIVLEGGRVMADAPVADAVRSYLEHHLAEAAAGWQLGGIRRAGDDLGDRVSLRHVAAVMARRDGFLFGEALHFRVCVHARARLDHVRCAIGLDNIYGGRVVTFTSDPEEVSVLPGLCYEFDVSVPPFGLLPGKYLLSASLLSGEQYHDYLVHFGAIRVLPIDVGGEPRDEARIDQGPIAVRSIWLASEREGMPA
ncbi:MAG: ABC transporter ATP-binding protein [Acidobacteria bacterium]|nr:ABC transporter ATP-binding protein [Acidobacteriota bacterium]